MEIERGDAAGEITLDVGKDITHNVYALRTTQDLGVVKYGGVVLVTNAMLDDAAMMRGAMQHAFDRRFRPWLFRDRNPMPTLVLFPRVERARLWWQRRRHSIALDYDE